MALVGVQLLLVFALVLDQVGVIFPIVWVLFFVDWMDAAAVFPVAVGMVHLCLARLQKTARQFRNPVGGSYVDIESIELMGNTLTRLGYIDLVTLDLVRGSHEQSKILRHFALYRHAKIEKNSLLD